MFRIIVSGLLLIIMICFPDISYSAPDHPEGLSGVVKDENGKSIPRVIVYLPELKTGTDTDSAGAYHLSHLPEGRFKIEFSHIGYKTVVQTVNIQDAHIRRDVTLPLSPVENSAILVTAPYAATAEQTPYAVAAITREEIQFSGATTLTEALTQVPGINQLSTGAGISKPVIRGLHGSRIQTIIEGFRFDNQQWQDEHGLGLSDMGIRGVEVIKGPATLLYGADAMAGVLNLVDEKPAPAGRTVSDLNMKIDANTLGLNTDLGVKGGSETFYWKARLGGDSHADYLDGDNERVPNTRFNGLNLSSGVGFLGKRLVSNLNYHYSFYQFGVVEQNEAEGKKKEEHFEREMEEAYHQVNYHLITTQNTIFAGASRLKIDAGAHFNNRQEQEGPEEQALGNLNMQLNTFALTPRYISPEFWNSELSAGFQATFQDNRNSGSRRIIPDATTRELAAYAYLRHQLNRLVIEEGLRFNQYHIQSEASGMADSIGYMAALEADYHPVTGSAGLLYSLTPGLQLKANFAMGYRAPNLAELTSNGLHEGTLNYEIGDPELRSELNREFDLGLYYHTPRLSIDAAVFRNEFDHYIFLSPTGEHIGDYPVYRFLQSDASLRGGEVSLNWRPASLNRLALRSSFTALVGKQKDGTYLPLMPANRMSHEVTVDTDIWRIFRDGFVKLGVVTVFDQTNLTAMERETPGYSLVNLSLGGKFLGQRIYASLAINNLLGKVYYDHLSRIKPGSFNDPEVGFNNMGRNITFALHIPLGGGA